jgi:hypothetical protein
MRNRRQVDLEDGRLENRSSSFSKPTSVPRQAHTESAVGATIGGFQEENAP